MSNKLLLISVFASFFLLFFTLPLKGSYTLHPNPTFDIPPSHRRLLSGSKFFKSPVNDPRTVILKDDADANDEAAIQSILAPIRICDRDAPIPYDLDILMHERYGRCPLLDRPPERTTILLLEGVETFGRTGNNLIEFFHSLQYARDQDVVVGIMAGSWPTHLLTPMWMAIQNDDGGAWQMLLEKAFCVKFIDSYSEVEKYDEVLRLDTRTLFTYKQYGPLNKYIEFQAHVLRHLWRSYNTGVGVDMRGRPVRDMCSVIDALFGRKKSSTKYSVIHSRSLEGYPGILLLGKIAARSGCDPLAALNMDPEYVKAILKPLGMLDHPILFLTDHQKPEILERLLADPEIGPNIHLAPEESSWVGGDITAALMADAFIGNPASTFSGFIAKSRIALGYDTNYLFRKKKFNGEWVNTLDFRYIFDHNIVNAMA
eukprot:CAMPEP_0183716296 /NCGR_PEP_ID=MMETSP0737-20130205/10264_1 /TAXON_ID=385413 /ORGANISM="Thalassiosira miniscula, Strain CCMP1093" /LENGTH=427 /DNA_ID=CAMNT_0025945547 /DNA_START=84 /DNA_END=1367 /DNA_ORIENTATION=+